MSNPETNHTPLIVQEDVVRKTLPELEVRCALTQMFRALGSKDAVQPP